MLCHIALLKSAHVSCCVCTEAMDMYLIAQSVYCTESAVFLLLAIADVFLNKF